MVRFNKKYSDKPSTGHKGFICIKHFHQNDLNIRNEKITLKKNATPTIFSSSEPSEPIGRPIVSNSGNSPNNLSDQNHENQPAPSAETTPAAPTQLTQINQIEDILKAEYSNLRQEYIELRTEKDARISELESVIKKLTMKAQIRKEQIQYLSVKVSQKEKSTQSLKMLLKDLRTKNVLSTAALETLEVIYHI